MITVCPSDHVKILENIHVLPFHVINKLKIKLNVWFHYSLFHLTWQVFELSQLAKPSLDTDRWQTKLGNENTKYSRKLLWLLAVPLSCFIPSKGYELNFVYFEVCVRVSQLFVSFFPRNWHPSKNIPPLPPTSAFQLFPQICRHCSAATHTHKRKIAFVFPVKVFQ